MGATWNVGAQAHLWRTRSRRSRPQRGCGRPSQAFLSSFANPSHSLLGYLEALDSEISSVLKIAPCPWAITATCGPAPQGVAQQGSCGTSPPEPQAPTETPEAKHLGELCLPYAILVGHRPGPHLWAPSPGSPDMPFI